MKSIQQVELQSALWFVCAKSGAMLKVVDIVTLPPTNFAAVEKGKKMSRLIDLEELLKFPIRIDHHDKVNGNEHFVLGIETVLEYAENLPTIEQPKWIPVSEGLPTEDGICLVYQTFNIWGEEHKIIGLEQFSKLLGGWYCDGAKITNVTHWMPLPSVEGLK